MDPEEYARKNGSYKDLPELSKKLKANIKAVEVTGDGSCLYHSVLYSMDSQGYRTRPEPQQKLLANKLRAMVFNREGRKHKRQYRCNTHNGQKICPDAAQHMVESLRDSLEMNLVFFDSDSRHKPYCDIDMDFRNKMMMVEWVNGMHFRPIVRVNRDGTTTGVFDPAVDHDLVSRALAIVSSQCKNCDGKVCGPKVSAGGSRR